MSEKDWMSYSTSVMRDVFWRTMSNSAADTEAIASAIGKRLRGGEVIDLIGDMGCGKTTFVRGLAKGLGCQATVNSPTYKINNVYSGQKLQLHHFDFYRITEPGILLSELAEIMTEPDIVTIIEWSDVVHDLLPKKQLAITFTQAADNQRRLHLVCPASLSYTLKELSEC